MQKDYEKKIRVQLFDPDFNQLSDKLVAQDLELKIGPKEPHNGPLKVEVCLFEETDINLFIEYLQRLHGTLPMNVPGKRGRKRIKADPESEEFSSEFVDMLLDTPSRDADEFGELVEKEGFIFTSYQLLKDLELPVNLPEDYIEPDDYRLLIRLIRKAKNPLNNKYDPTLILAVSKMKDDPRVVVIHFNKEVGELELENFKASKIKVPTSNMTKFPTFMTQEERNKFRVERDKLIKEPEKEATKFYKRWVHMVAEENTGKGIEFPRIDTIPKPY